MTVIVSPVRGKGENFVLARQYTQYFAVGWVQHHAVETGRTIVLEEEIYGGFKLHITLKEDFWNWNSSSWKFIDIFDDFYATFPGSETPVDALDQYFDFEVSPAGVLVARTYQPNEPDFIFHQELPANPPSGYWFQHPPETQPEHFIYDNT